MRDEEVLYPLGRFEMAPDWLIIESPRFSPTCRSTWDDKRFEVKEYESLDSPLNEKNRRVCGGIKSEPYCAAPEMASGKRPVEPEHRGPGRTGHQPDFQAGGERD